MTCNLVELENCNRNKMLALTPVPLQEYEGVIYPSHRSVRQKGIETVLSDVKQFMSRESDILISTFLKSGSHWIYEIVAMIINNTNTLEKNCIGQKRLEGIPDISVLDRLPSPRILTTHLRFNLLPNKYVENGGKIIHMVRNPKDVCVSLYHHVLKDAVTYMDITWNDFFELWLSGKIPYGSWYDYELGMEEAKKDYPGLIYICYYEDMITNTVPEIKKLANFLEVDVTDVSVKAIASETSFDNMQKNKQDNTIFVNVKEQNGFIYRKGKIGDWKNYFTVAQNERFDVHYKEKMKKSGYVFRFE